MMLYNLRNRISLVALATAIASLAAPVSANAQQAESSPAEASGLSGDIVVTARKREESLLKTPVTISAITSELLEKKGIVSINDVVGNTPGINVSNSSAGRNDRSFQQISLRGMTPSTATSTLTATFINGVPVASATALSTVTDPARLEVLRGPQSAYFGRNTFAGAINVVTKVPGNEWSGNMSASVANRGAYDIRAGFEGPIIEDILTFRLAGQAYKKGGSYNNAAAPGQRLGDQQTRNASLTLAFRPSDNLKINAFSMISRDNDGPPAQAIISAYELRANAGVLNVPFFSGSTAGTVILPSQANCTLTGFATSALAGAAQTVRPFICGALPAFNSAFTPAQNTTLTPRLSQILADGRFRVADPSRSVDGYGLKREYVHSQLTIDWELGDSGISLSSLTGYNNEYYSQMADLDNYDSSLIANPAYATNNTLIPYFDFPFVVERKTRDFSQELRANYETDRLRVMLGASYLWTRSDNDLLSVRTELGIGGNRLATTYSPPQQSRNIAAFGAINYNLTDAFKISLEGRYQRDTISAFSGGAGTTISPTNLYGLPSGTFAPLTEFFKKSFSNFLPRVILNYEVTNDVMMYASWSKAVNVSLASFNTTFISRSPTIVAAANSIGLGVLVNPEKLTNYEVGIKGRFFDGMLIASLAAYRANWTAQQNNRSIFVVDQAPPTGTGLSEVVSGLANSGNTRLTGVELEMTARPVRGVTIDLAASINESDIRSFADPSVSFPTGIVGAGFIGNQLPLSSKYSLNGGVQFDGTVSDIDWFIRTDVSYKSKQFLDAANITWIKGRAQVNARLNANFGQFALEVFVTNLLNDRNYVTLAPNRLQTPANTFGTAPTSYVQTGLPELRSIGVRGSVKF